jgi:Rha family phage regulatory protein
MTALTIASPPLSVVRGQATTTSNEVAQHFGKRHADLLRAIETIVADCPKEFTERNFALSEFTDSTGRKLPAYRLTRDGFTLLAMGFTGKRALHFKLAYIDAFNRMEAALRTPAQCVPDMLRAADLLAKTAKALRDGGVPKQKALAQALEEVHRQTGVRMLPDYTSEKVARHKAHEQIVKYVKNAKRYAADRRFGELCAQGLMPHSKLLKLVAIPACEFSVVVDEALQKGTIRKDTSQAGAAYTLTRQ